MRFTVISKSGTTITRPLFHLEQTGFLCLCDEREMLPVGSFVFGWQLHRIGWHGGFEAEDIFFSKDDLINASPNGKQSGCCGNAGSTTNIETANGELIVAQFDDCWSCHWLKAPNALVNLCKFDDAHTTTVAGLITENGNELIVRVALQADSNEEQAHFNSILAAILADELEHHSAAEKVRITATLRTINVRNENELTGNHTSPQWLATSHNKKYSSPKQRGLAHLHESNS